MMICVTSIGEIRSLLWWKGQLIDPVRGVTIEGKDQVRLWDDYSSEFDGACCSPSGEYVALFQRYGVSGVLLRDGKPHRPIKRDPYCAQNFAFPLVLFALADGREVLASCPESYCRIELVCLETGERLTPPTQNEPIDFFHSRFATSPDGKWLASAGWVWHPYDSIMVFDIERAISEPGYLGGQGEIPDLNQEVTGASFTDSSQLYLASPRQEDSADLFQEPAFPYQSLAC